MVNVQVGAVTDSEPPMLLKTVRDGGCAGLSSGLIRRGSRASAEDRARPQLQVTGLLTYRERTSAELGKRVGRQPSRVRISHPPAMPSRDDRAGLRQHSCRAMSWRSRALARSGQDLKQPLRWQ
jgi:hypothetical protein